MGKTLLLVALIAFAVVGGIVGLAIFRGWRRRGYFTITATIVIVLGLFFSFQAIGAILYVILKAMGIAHDNGLLIVNGVSQLLVMLGGAILVSRIAEQDPYAVFRLQGFGETRAGTYLLALPIVLSAQFFGGAISALWTQALTILPFYPQLQHVEQLSDQSMEGLVTAQSVGQFIVILLTVAVIPAFAEETLFRGFTQSNIERSGKHGPRPMIALLVTSLMFAAYHTSVFKFPGLLVLGGALGWMAYRTNNLFVGSLGHAVNNGLIVTALALTPETLTSTAQKNLVGSTDMTTSEAIIAVVIWLPALLASLYWFARHTEAMTARFAPQEEYEHMMLEEQAFDHDAHYDNVRPDDADHQIGT